MPSLTKSAIAAGTSCREANRPRRREDLAYQAMTIGAIVTVLATVWVF